MRWLIAVLAIMALSGCASTPGGFSEPVYDRSAHAVLADDYRITRLYLPEDFKFVGHPKTDQHSGFVFSDKSSRLLELGYISDSMDFDNKALTAQGYRSQEVKSGEVFYFFDRGVYADIATRTEVLSEGSGECAVGVLVFLIQERNRSGMMATYAEGRDCGELSDFGDYQQQKLKNTAYSILRLN